MQGFTAEMPRVQRLWRRALAVAVAAAPLTTIVGVAPARAQAPLASCVPAALNGSAELPGTTITVSPQPGALDATPATQISFLGAPAADLGELRVVGSRSGAHSGRLQAYSQGDGASFVPRSPFQAGETVTVSGAARVGGASVPMNFSFGVAVPDAIPTDAERTHSAATPGDVQSFASRPDLHPPAVTVTSLSDRVASGDNFVAPYGGPGQSGPMIFDSHGALVWFKPLPASTDATDLEVQSYQGRPVLTWWQGEINAHGFGWGEGIVDSTSYGQVAVVRAGNGVQVDLHEFQLTPAGTALVSAYNPVQCNLSALGGPAQGAVTDAMLQEVDIRTGLVRYEWTSLDHVGLDESYTPVRTTSRRWPFDFFHLNSIDAGADGSLLLSARDTWAAYDVDRRTGQIQWRLGGKRSTFALGAGVATAWQHDARRLPDGDISLFDNGASPAVHAQSRGLVVHLDAQPPVASVVSQFSRSTPPPLLSPSQGNLQELDNGDWLMGFGELSDFSEFTSTGTLLFDAHFPAAVQSYRDLRYDWSATPTRPPSLAIRSTRSGLTVRASWNGATSVASWRVLGGSRPGSLRPLASAARDGFETAIRVAGLPSYVVAQALNASGRVLGTAPATRG